MTPSEKAREIAPCYGTGDTGPTECSAEQMCELHFRIAAALTEYGEWEYEKGHLAGCSSEAQRVMAKIAHKNGYARGIEEAAKVAEEDRLEGGTMSSKTGHFIAMRIRALAREK